MRQKPYALNAVRATAAASHLGPAFKIGTRFSKWPGKFEGPEALAVKCDAASRQPGIATRCDERQTASPGQAAQPGMKPQASKEPRRLRGPASASRQNVAKPSVPIGWLRDNFAGLRDGKAFWFDHGLRTAGSPEPLSSGMAHPNAPWHGGGVGDTAPL